MKNTLIGRRKLLVGLAGTAVASVVPSTLMGDVSQEVDGLVIDYTQRKGTSLTPGSSRNLREGEQESYYLVSYTLESEPHLRLKMTREQMESLHGCMGSLLKYGGFTH